MLFSVSCIFYILVHDSSCSRPKPSVGYSSSCSLLAVRGLVTPYLKPSFLIALVFPKSYQALGRVPHCFLRGREWEFSALLWVGRQPGMLMLNTWQGWLCPDFSPLHPVLMSRWAVPRDTEREEKAQAAGTRCACTRWLPTFIDKNLGSLVSVGRSVKVTGVVYIFRLVCLLEKE